MNAAAEIRSLIAPISGGGILLPGSMIAEVINFSEPEAFPASPDWLLGEIRWNGWQIPVVNFALLAGLTSDDVVPERARVLVVKTLSLSASILHIGMIIEGLPRLKSVTPANLVETKVQAADGVFSHVQVEDQDAVIPDLDALALSIEKLVYNR